MQEKVHFSPIKCTLQNDTVFNLNNNIPSILYVVSFLFRRQFIKPFRAVGELKQRPLILKGTALALELGCLYVTHKSLYCYTVCIMILRL